VASVGYGGNGGTQKPGRGEKVSLFKSAKEGEGGKVLNEVLFEIREKKGHFPKETQERR